LTSSQNTRDRYERQLRLHVYPTLGSCSLSAIHPSTIRAWLRKLQDVGLSDGYRRLLFQDLSVIFNAAVDDRVMLSNPCAAKTVKPPRRPPAKVRPWSAATVRLVRSNLAPRARVAVDLGA